MKFIVISLCLVVAVSGCSFLENYRSNQELAMDFLSRSIKEREIARINYQAQKDKERKKQVEGDVQAFLKNDLKDVEPLGIKARPISPEVAISAAVERYQKEGKTEPIIAANDLVLFPYGLSSEPKVVCTYLTSCAILLSDEKVLSMHPGDSVRWFIAQTVAGDGQSIKPVIIVKPLVREAISTNLLIATNKRMYSIRLMSVEEGAITPRIGFFYPQQPSVLSQESYSEAAKTAEKISDGSFDLRSVGQLNFNYSVQGRKDCGFFPIRAFDDGQKFYIQMKENLQELPVFVALNSSGGNEAVNYRYRNGFYIVDYLVEKGMLLLISNGKEQRIVITKNKKG